MEVVLTIAGSDSSAGAGIQQDLKTITALGCYGATVITAITSQNTMGVQHVMPVPAEVVGSQIESVLSDLDVKAVKIGMVPNKEVAECIVRLLRKYHCQNVVYDPVMISTSGTRLMEDDCLDYVQHELMSLCMLVTPNIPEAEVLNLQVLVHEGVSCLVKGGHADSEEMTDTLLLPDGSHETFVSERIITKNLHGTGCTLSSAIASFLAKGESLTEAVRLAKEHIKRAILAGRHLGVGHGNGPLWL
jgi:hydroxymethylpyrimidine/phosphomethylpyrimidine kinase